MGIRIRRWIHCYSMEEWTLIQWSRHHFHLSGGSSEFKDHSVQSKLLLPRRLSHLDRTWQRRSTAGVSILTDASLLSHLAKEKELERRDCKRDRAAIILSVSTRLESNDSCICMCHSLVFLRCLENTSSSFFVFFFGKNEDRLTDGSSSRYEHSK